MLDDTVGYLYDIWTEFSVSEVVAQKRAFSTLLLE